MKIFLKRFLVGSFVLYALFCVGMYFFQEKLIFNPTPLAQDTKIEFEGNFKEMSFKTKDGNSLSGILKTVENSKGLVFYLHGNKGNLNRQLNSSNFYARLGYDYFTMDYRAFGKSTGELKNDELFYADVRLVYDSISKIYPENKIRVIGYSLGTASAAMIASQRKPKSLTLLAPYFSIVQLTSERYKIIPQFLIKYPFETNKFLPKVKCRIQIQHGTEDEVLPYSGGKELTKFFKTGDEFVTLKGQKHRKLELNPLFVKKTVYFLK
jgi:hypothetical protein